MAGAVTGFAVISPRLAVLLIGLALAAPGFGQTPAPMMDWQYSTAEVLSTLDGPPPEWRNTFGPGISAQPAFMGAKRYQTLPSAIFDIRYKDEFFLSDAEGIGVNLLHEPGFRAGVGMGYDFGRNTHDDPRLRDLPNVSFAPEPKIFAQYFLFPLVLTATLRKGIGGNDGVVGDLGAYVPVPLTQDRTWLLFAGPSVTLADRRYMNAYFGVAPDSSRLSGLRSFEANGGFSSAGAGLTNFYLIGDHWLLEGDFAYRRFLGDAARSPVIETKIQTSVDFNVGYRF